MTDDLFEAFVAGFHQSAEGFNGEYLGGRYDGPEGSEADDRLRAVLREAFEAWRQKAVEA